MLNGLTLEIDDFGVINHANIEFGNITVVGGVNASGKSTASKLLYCFLKAMSLNRNEYILRKIVPEINSFINTIESPRDADHKIPDKFTIDDGLEDILRGYEMARNKLAHLSEDFVIPEEFIYEQKIFKIDKYIPILKGNKEIAPDFYELLLEEAANMLVISGAQKDLAKARALMEEKIENGEALAKLRQMIKWQGASPAAVDNPEGYFKTAPLKAIFQAPKAGYVAHIDAKTAGMAAVLLGAGRNTMEDKIDYGAGIWLERKAGDAVHKGDTIAILYASDKKRLAEGLALFAQSVKITKQKPTAYKIVKEVIK